MFAPPKLVKTEVFARVPDNLRNGMATKTSGPLPPSELRKHFNCFLEGPVFDRKGDLFTVDTSNGRILRFSPQGEVSVAAEYGGMPNGLTFRQDGLLFIADRDRGILTLDTDSGRMETVLSALPTAPFKGPNDLIFTKNGDLYFTDQGQSGLHDWSGRLVRLRANGHVDVLLNEVPSPNGLVVNKAESAILLAVTRANAVWHVPMVPLGQEQMRVGAFIQLSGGPGGGPDGLAIDDGDNLVIAHVRMGCAWIFNRLGEPLYRVQSCTGDMVTNLIYDPKSPDTLYITESATGTVLRATIPREGRY